jgi:flagellar hook-basal body complex protein FliE
MASPSIAANAYASLARITNPGAAGAAGKSSEVSGGQSFASMLKDAVGSVVDAGGKANVIDVVTAVAETEVAVSTLVSVRDRVIQSYEEIMRMPI